MDINYICTRKRKEFGKPCAFTDIGPSLLFEVYPDPSLRQEFDSLSTVNREIDNTTKVCAHEVNTVTYPVENRGMNHTEGGWPAAVDNTDEESMTRFKKKFEKDKNYVNTVKSLADFMENFIMENNSIDIYEEYFEGESIKRDTDWSITATSIYQDFGYRSIADLSWEKDSTKFAAVYTLKKNFNDFPSQTCHDSYVWDVQNNIKPLYVMKPEVPMTVAEFSPTHSDLIISGCIDGQIALWDLRTENRAQLSSVSDSHSQKVTGVKWLRSKQDTGCFSVSSDGSLMSWDIANLSSPTEVINLGSGENGSSLKLDQNYAISCAEYDITEPDKFMIGTEQSVVLSFNRIYKQDEDRLRSQYDTLGGPLLNLERNAFYPQLFSSCDAWSIKLWSESVTDAPILNLLSQDGYFTDFAWSSTRASTMYVTKTTGVIEVWDIPGKNKQPLSISKLDNEALLAIAVSHSGKQLVCGSLSGSIQLLNIPEYLRSSSDLEKSIVKDCIHEFGDIVGGCPRSERVLEQEATIADDGMDEEYWDPPDKAEDLQEEYTETFKNFPPETDD